MDRYLILSIIESIYIIYMYNFFKTNKSIHHPLEMIMQKNINGFLKHPISTGIYENKICNFGKLISYLLAFLIMSRYIYRNKIRITNIIILILVFILSFILNMNSFVYLIPVFILEIFNFIRKNKYNKNENKI